MFTRRRSLAEPAPVTRPALRQRPSSDPQSPRPGKVEVSSRVFTSRVAAEVTRRTVARAYQEIRLVTFGGCGPADFSDTLSAVWLMICCIYLARTTINLTKPNDYENGWQFRIISCAPYMPGCRHANTIARRHPLGDPRLDFKSLCRQSHSANWRTDQW